MKNKLFLNEKVLELYEQKFKKEILINFFAVYKYVYCSQNFKDTKLIYRYIGELSGIPVNSWEEEKKLTNVFLISELDYDNFLKGVYSEELNFIINLINKQQTKKDTEEKKLSSDIYIVRENIFLEYFSDRKTFIEKCNAQDYEFSKELLFQIMKDYDFL